MNISQNKNIRYRILNKFGDIFFPEYCLVCHQGNSYLCNNCKTKLKPYPEICSLCNKYSQSYNICLSCKKNFKFQLEQVIIGFYYNSNIKKLILSLKYKHRYSVTKFLSKRLSYILNIYCGFLSPTPPKKEIAIMGVPSHWWRKYFVKGYNQSELLAKSLAKETNIPYLSAIKKIKNTPSQVALNRQQRIKNLNNAFSLKQDTKTNLKNLKHLIIVDDITTTGTSLNNLATVIKKTFPHILIYGIVLAKK